MRVINEYLHNGNNATAAYRSVFGSDGSYQAAAASAYKLFKDPRVAELLLKAASEPRQPTPAVAAEGDQAPPEVLAHRLSLDGIKAELASIAYATSGISKADKRGALMDLARLSGYVVEKKQFKLVKSYGDLSDEELEALAADERRIRDELAQTEAAIIQSETIDAEDDAPADDEGQEPGS